MIVAWACAAGSALVLSVNELWLQRRAHADGQGHARAVHARLRQAWVQAMSNAPGAEILAIQTLRNSLMAATISASTSALMGMGAVNLLVSRHPEVRLSMPAEQAFGAALLLALFLCLFASFACSAMSTRYWGHSTFILSLPVGSAQRAAFLPLASEHVRRAGLLYSWGLRLILMTAVPAAGLLNPALMPVAAVGVVLALRPFDRASSVEAPSD
jgi:hypothetical protein